MYLVNMISIVTRAWVEIDVVCCACVVLCVWCVSVLFLCVCVLVATFSCTSPYSLQGSPTSVCLDPTYVFTLPTCELRCSAVTVTYGSVSYDQAGPPYATGTGKHTHTTLSTRHTDTHGGTHTEKYTQQHTDTQNTAWARDTGHENNTSARTNGACSIASARMCISFAHCVHVHVADVLYVVCCVLCAF